MSETIQANWTEHLLEPTADWMRVLSKIPVIKETTISPDGETLKEELAVVGPVIPSNEDRITPVVALFYEEGPTGKQLIREEVTIESLKQSGWVDPNGVEHLIEFVSFANDEGLKNKKWSCISPYKKLF